MEGCGIALIVLALAMISIRDEGHSLLRPAEMHKTPGCRRVFCSGLFPFLQEALTILVGHQQRGVDLVGINAARHIVNGFAFSAGGFRHQTHFGRDITFDIQLRQVIGSPTLWHSNATVSISSTGAFSSTSCVRVPNATFSP